MKAIRPSDDCDAQRPPPPRGRTPGRKGRTRQSVSLTPLQPNTRKVVPGAGAAGMTGEPLARAIDDTAALLMDISELIRDRDPTGRLGSGAHHALAMKLSQLTRQGDLLTVAPALRRLLDLVNHTG